MHVSSWTKMPYHGRTNGKFMTLEACYVCGTFGDLFFHRNVCVQLNHRRKYVF